MDVGKNQKTTNLPAEPNQDTLMTAKCCLFSYLLFCLPLLGMCEREQLRGRYDVPFQQTPKRDAGSRVL